MSNASIRVVAQISALPDKVEEVKALLMGLIEPGRRDEGCLNYELLQNRADPTQFTFIEEWVSDAAIDAHLASAHIAAAMAKVPELVARGPDIQRYDLLG